MGHQKADIVLEIDRSSNGKLTWHVNFNQYLTYYDDDFKQLDKILQEFKDLVPTLLQSAKELREKDNG